MRLTTLGSLLISMAAACGPPAHTGFDSADAGDAGAVDGGADAPSNDARAGTDAGPCGGICGVGKLCCSGACVHAASCSFSVTSAKPAYGMLDGGAWVTLMGAGFAPGMKVFFGKGRAPVLVQGPTTALVQTPPGPVGPADIHIVSGSNQATLPGGFTYQTTHLQGPWVQKTMHTVRGRSPAMAVMQDGRVLIAGGTTGYYTPNSALDTAEIFDRTTNSMSTVASTMSTVRWYAQAVTLLDGRVLVVGGACWQDLSDCTGDPTRADLFDPVAGTFAPTHAPLNKPRVFPRMVLMADGRVLLSSSNDPTLEIFDPATGTFSLATPKAPHGLGFVASLLDGRILLGGALPASASAELFDPDTGTFATTGSLVTGRFDATAHTLPDGRVVVVGGSLDDTGTWNPIDSVEIYDPASGKFAAAPYSSSSPRYEHASALVGDGTILALGGFSVSLACTPTGTVDEIDPAKNTLVAFASLPQVAAELSAVTLLDGSVLAAGGGGCGPLPMPYVDFLEGHYAPPQ